MTAVTIAARARHAEPRQSAGHARVLCPPRRLGAGVRLFRKVSFTSKALFVSLAFMVPITLLLVAYLQTIQESLNFTSDERAGVQLLLQVEP